MDALIYSILSHGDDDRRKSPWGRIEGYSKFPVVRVVGTSAAATLYIGQRRRSFRAGKLNYVPNAVHSYRPITNVRMPLATCPIDRSPQLFASPG